MLLPFRLNWHPPYNKNNIGACLRSWGPVDQVTPLQNQKLTLGVPVWFLLLQLRSSFLLRRWGMQWQMTQIAEPLPLMCGTPDGISDFRFQPWLWWPFGVWTREWKINQSLSSLLPLSVPPSGILPFKQISKYLVIIVTVCKKPSILLWYTKERINRLWTPRCLPSSEYSSSGKEKMTIQS